MTKKDFETFLRGNLKKLPLEEQEALLEKIRDKWMPDITSKLDKRIEKSYIKCLQCGRYSLTKSFKIEKKEEKRYGIQVYVDRGYGDGDEVADVTYMVTYYTCPICGGLTEKNKIEMYQENRHKARDY